jgi:hypothetical protein
MSFIVRTLREINQEIAASESFSRLRGLEFWIAHRKEHAKQYDRTGGSCCFNHAIKLPERPIGFPHPIYDYEIDIVNKLEQRKHLWIKKASGIGITELCLRYICYKALCTNEWDNSQVCIVCGNRIDLAITLIRRIKAFFPDTDFDTRETILQLGNNVRIEAFPSHHLAAMRGLTNVKFILISEADFFPPGQQIEARHVSERYIGKSQAQIVMESTPNAPNQLYETIEREEPCLYDKVFLPYDIALGKMYTEQDILAARQSPSFDREYLLKYVGTQGNLFSYESIQRAVDLGQATYDPANVSMQTLKFLGIDAGFSSSNFAFCIAELVNTRNEKTREYDQQINILVADELHRPLFHDAINHMTELISNYGIARVFIDSANSDVIASLKWALGENPQYQQELEFLKERDQDPEIWSTMKVLPVSFKQERRSLAAHSKELLDAPGILAIHPSLAKLITALRTANFIEFDYQKQASSFDDIYDAFSLSLKPLQLVKLPRQQEQ